MTNVVWVVSGAALGATARYLLGGWIAASVRGGFPWGTLAVNLLGCFVIGVLWSLGERASWSIETRTFLFVGVLGSFTTFSSFGIETLSLFRQGASLPALAYVTASNLGGLALAWLGSLAGRPAA